MHKARGPRGPTRCWQTWLWDTLLTRGNRSLDGQLEAGLRGKPSLVLLEGGGSPSGDLETKLRAKMYGKSQKSRGQAPEGA